MLYIAREGVGRSEAAEGVRRQTTLTYYRGQEVGLFLRALWHHGKVLSGRGV